MGPSILFDKSFLQSLSLDEAVWFDAFFYPCICPIFFVETLADLSKQNAASHLAPDADVARIVLKTPEMHGGACAHHVGLCINDLMGWHPPLNGQIPRAGAKRVREAERRGLVFEKTPEEEALVRWQREEFEVERLYAKKWRDDLERINLSAIAQKMRAAGISSSTCRSLADARDIALAFVGATGGQFEKMALLVASGGVSPDYATEMLKRWHINNYRSILEHAPYAAHVLAVEVFFQSRLPHNKLAQKGRLTELISDI